MEASKAAFQETKQRLAKAEALVHTVMERQALSQTCLDCPMLQSALKCTKHIAAALRCTPISAFSFRL